MSSEQRAEYDRGYADTYRASDSTKRALLATCNDNMPDGRMRWQTDAYWYGVMAAC